MILKSVKAIVSTFNKQNASNTDYMSGRQQQSELLLL